MRMIYQDEHLAVAYKPYGVLSEKDEKKPNMPDLIAEQTGQAAYTVHRLDRTTQGLMVYALTQNAAKDLSAQIQSGEMEKTYLAVVEGEPEACGEMTDLLFFDRQKNKSFVVKRERKGVKLARLRYEVLGTVSAEETTLSLVRIMLDTGRTHQIRVQFSSRGFPIAGDRRYGSKLACEDIRLCSSELSFFHPVTGERMRFSYTPINEYFELFK